ncbi:MAG: hypothetical protein AAFQ94_31360 [Bacteroidota bacterium]
MKQLITLLLIMCLTGVFSLSYAQSEYLMMEKGKVFKYKYGNVYGPGLVDEGTILKVEVLNATKTIEGKEYLTVQSSTGSDGNFSVDLTSYTRVSGNGSVYTRLEDEINKETVMLRAPLKVGDSWEEKGFGGETASKKIIGFDGSITTPTATYSDCLVLETQQNGTQSKSYFKKNIGMVATTVTMGGEEKLFIYLLED